MKRSNILGLCLVLMSGPAAPAATNTLIAMGSNWKYLDNGSNQGTNWVLRAFDDGSWTNGPAQLGYGDGDEATVVEDNPTPGYVPTDNNRYITTYFRHTFNVPVPSIYTVLQLRLVRDDGVVVYLNGFEVYRNNLGTGPIAYNTLAANAGDDGTLVLSTTVNAGLLITGDNVIAAEIHQTLPTSSDISFDLELLGSTDPVINNPPAVTLSSPGTNAFFTEPANIAITANASDSDGSISRVEFFQGNTKLGEDATFPYTFDWNSVPAGNFALRAVATDNLDARSTSSVVNVTVGFPTSPTIVSANPTAGSVSSLMEITVTFSEPVQGVNAADLLINGVAAASVSGSGAAYTFRFPQPRDGTVYVAWEGRHGIVDFETPPKPFNPHGAGATWQYNLTDTVAPVVAGISPAPGATLRGLTEVSVTFSEPVSGVGAGDLRINGRAATGVSGSGSGPYVFAFAPPTNSPAQVTWTASHGIRDFASVPNNFAGGPWAYTLDTNAVFVGKVVINEIMYHPASENVAEEYVELVNIGIASVNLGGWQLTRGVNFTFPGVTLAAGAYLVVAADLAAFSAKYPAVTNVVGGWAGRLANTREDVELEDASGDRVDLVSYADQGDFAVRTSIGGSWEWVSQADGFGRSLELRNPALENNTGQNWLPSAANDGTPGQVNSVATNDIPPMLLEAAHFPAAPRSSDVVTISARVVDELTNELTVRVWYRDATSVTPPAFTNAAMFDDGLHNDGAAGDGVFAVELAAMGNGTLVEFYLEARDAGGQTRTWPAAGDLSGSPVQEANAFFQFDDGTYTGPQPIYRLLMRVTDRNNFFNLRDRIVRNVTLITTEGGDVEVRHNCSVRRRGQSSFGATPPTLKLEIPTDRPWNNRSGINLNSIFTWAQVVGSALSVRAGLPAPYTRPVQVRFNGVNESQSGSQQFGAYAHVEVANGEFAQDHFPDDGAGNVYSKRRPECALLYRGTNPQNYINCGYDKESNASENDWNDLANLHFALDPGTTPDADYVQAVRRNANVELWLRYFVVLFLMNYNETALSNGADDDYDLYRGVADPRFLILPHDFDSIFGSSGLSDNNLFEAADGSGSPGTGGVPIIGRFLRHPEFLLLYYEEYRRQLGGAFATNNLFPLFDQFLTDWVPAPTIQNMKNVAVARINYVLSVLPPAPVVVRATVSSEPASPTYLDGATLTVGGTDITQYRYRLNNGTWSAEQQVGQPITLSGLADGHYTVYVVGRNSGGTWQADADATISKTWAVLAGLRGLVINEVLARNVAAVNHSGTFPDLIELFNAGSTLVDLSGLRLTDDPENPNKFAFSSGTTLAAGEYLVLYANNPDATPGIHLGFSLNQDGEGVYLFDTPANGNRLLDAVVFGLQLADLSVGRQANGHWGLCAPSFGSANVAAATGDPRVLRINEWLASGAAPFFDDFIEIYNPDPLPVAIGGLYLTDVPIGLPFRHRITPLSFIAGQGYRAFIADGNAGAGADHVNFQLTHEVGEIALVAADGTILDGVIYGLQKPGISQGRTPSGGTRLVFFGQPTPGAGNPVAPEPVPPLYVNLVPYDHVWRYDQTGTNLGSGWSATNYNDSTWLSGPGLLAAMRPNGTLPEPVRTPLTVSSAKVTFYFRTIFNVSNPSRFSAVQLTHIFDDGAVVYLNGVEVYRYNLPSGPISSSTLASANILDSTYVGPVNLPLGALLDGDNHLAVEMHQASSTSADIVMGFKLDGVIITNNPAQAGVLLNELLANNQSVTNAGGSVADWVELFNPSNTAVDLADMSLTDNLSNPRRWVFPPGSVIPASGYFVVRFDGNLPASITNTGYGIGAAGDAVYLFNAAANGGALLDFITFGLQAPDLAIGRVPNASTNWALTLPTAGSTNIPASLGDPAVLKINEWMANPLSGDGWFEIYNPNAQPVALAGLHLTDDLNNRIKHSIAPLSFIGAGLQGFQRFAADNNVGAGADHVNFDLRLAAGGGSLGIATAGGVLIDRITFGPQLAGASQGRLLDGTSNIVSFAQTPTPGESNFLPIQYVVINEALTHTDPPLEDAIELRNLSGSPLNIGGWFLSDSRLQLKKFRIPDGTVIPANGYQVFYENEFNPLPGDPLSFALSSVTGDEVHLSVADTNGTLTGYRAVASFGASENGVSFGRFATSVGVEFVAQSVRTLGADTPDTIEEFRTGTGLPNGYPKVGPVVISEIMYHPPDIGGTADNTVDEYIRLRNNTAGSVELFDAAYPTNRWRLSSAVNFDFPSNTTLPAGGELLIVSFDPATAPATLAAFRSAYNLPASVAIVGPYSGQLDNSGESVELYKPDTPQPAGTPDAGFVPYILVERVAYADSAPWPTGPDGGGTALRRLEVTLFGNDPGNWVAGLPMSGPEDSDSDGLPDSWEIQYGLNTDDPNDAGLDNDNDGMTNLEEFLAGTHPLNPASNLRLRSVLLSPVTLEFIAVSNKSYTVEYRNSLNTGSWLPLLHVAPESTSRSIQLTNNAAVPTRFYRVRSPQAQ